MMSSQEIQSLVQIKVNKTINKKKKYFRGIVNFFLTLTYPQSPKYLQWRTMLTFKIHS